MGQSNNREPRRQWKSESNRTRVPCASCGAEARLYAANLPFCNACLDGSRQSSFAEWDELGAGD